MREKVQLLVRWARRPNSCPASPRDGFYLVLAVLLVLIPLLVVLVLLFVFVPLSVAFFVVILLVMMVFAGYLFSLVFLLFRLSFLTITTPIATRPPLLFSYPIFPGAVVSGGTGT